MSYREENGQVVLTMSREDYEKLLWLLGTASGAAAIGRSVFLVNDVLRFMDRLNLGNPNYTPYTVATPAKEGVRIEMDPLTKLSNYLSAHQRGIDMSWCGKVIEEARVELERAHDFKPTAAPASASASPGWPPA
jgi:hypothetical protein